MKIHTTTGIGILEAENKSQTSVVIGVTPYTHEDAKPVLMEVANEEFVQFCLMGLALCGAVLSKEPPR